MLLAGYDSDKALQHRDQGKVTFAQGKTALKFFNNRLKTLPYLQKDPRMCTTPMWLKLLEDKPAAVLMYRHPLEVAMSLKHWEQKFTIEHGLRLWIIYNQKALQNAEGLCRVFSTNEAVFKDPWREISKHLRQILVKSQRKTPQDA